MGKRKERTLPVLARHGIIRKGTEIELMPAVRSPDAAQQDPRIFLATIEDTSGLQQSIRWAFDSQLYSLTELTLLLRDRYGATPNVSLYFSNWQRVGMTESLYHEAERYPR